MPKLLIFSTIFLSVTIFLCMFRAVKGPTAADRLIAVNVIGTKTIVLILVASLILRESFFIDVALVYALINFTSSVVIAIYIKELGGRIL